jgi:hypothetical protein
MWVKEEAGVCVGNRKRWCGSGKESRGEGRGDSETEQERCGLDLRCTEKEK